MSAPGDIRYTDALRQLRQQYEDCRANGFKGALTMRLNFADEGELRTIRFDKEWSIDLTERSA